MRNPESSSDDLQKEPTFPIDKKAEAQKLPAVYVNNIVDWVNKDVEMPFDLKKGKPADLAMFFTPQRVLDPRFLEVWQGHNRSAMLGRVVFRDKEGRLYRDVDVKGAGYVADDWGSKMPPPVGWERKMHVVPLEKGHALLYSGSQGSERGFLDWGYAASDRDYSEFFLKKGLRTHRVLAIIDLKEIVRGDGAKISIAQARREKIIKKETVPVIQVRAFGIKARVQDGGKKEHLEEALSLVATELGKDKISPDEYLKWFAKTLGEQVAIIHREGYYHHYLTSHNITLDCRIVDLDSVVKNRKNQLNNARRDFTGAFASLNRLASHVRTAMSYEERYYLLEDLFMESYKTHMQGSRFLAMKEVQKYLKTYE